MKTKILAVVGALALVAAPVVAQAGIVDGDTFTGALHINLSTPHACPGGCPANLYALPMVNGLWSQPIGSITVSLDDETLSNAITVISSSIPGGSFSWEALAIDAYPTLNGTQLSNGLISLILYGSTTSTGSISPEAFSAYTSSELSIQVAGITVFSPLGLTSLTQVDDQGDFAFTGIIKVFDPGGGGGGTAAVPGP